jgi:hypothetical protein
MHALAEGDLRPGSTRAKSALGIRDARAIRAASRVSVADRRPRLHWNLAEVDRRQSSRGLTPLSPPSGDRPLGAVDRTASYHPVARRTAFLRRPSSTTSRTITAAPRAGCTWRAIILDDLSHDHCRAPGLAARGDRDGHRSWRCRRAFPDPVADRLQQAARYPSPRSALPQRFPARALVSGECGRQMAQAAASMIEAGLNPGFANCAVCVRSSALFGHSAGIVLAGFRRPAGASVGVRTR